MSDDALLSPTNFQIYKKMCLKKYGILGLQNQ